MLAPVLKGCNVFDNTTTGNHGNKWGSPKKKSKNNDPSELLNASIDFRIATAIEMTLTDAKKCQKLAFCPNIFTLCTLPHSNPKDCDGAQLNEYSRHNGCVNFSIEGAPPIFPCSGIPYGTVPRRILIYLATQAKRTGDRDIDLGGSMSAFMGKIGLNANGGKRGDIARLKAQAARLFACRVFSWRTSGDNGLEWDQFVLSDRGGLWWDPVFPEKNGKWRSHIVLSERAFCEMTINAVPIDMRPVQNDKSIGSSALGLDLYCWLPYRAWKARISGKESAIPWRGLLQQFGSGYPDTPQGIRDFRKKASPILDLICAYYPGIRIALDSMHLVIRADSTF